MGEMNIQPESTQQQSDARSRDIATRIRLRIFGFLSGWLMRIVGATWRVQILGDDPRRAPGGTTTDESEGAALAALFHESMLPCVWFFRDRGYSAAVSRSRDGDLICATLRSLGFREPSRGSSSRGGSAALRGLVRQLSDGVTVSVLVDGPRGPAQAAKTGIVSLARLAGTSIQPIVFAARPALRLKSWDRTLVPLPFARVVCAFGAPQTAPIETEDFHEQAAARRLDQALIELRVRADQMLGLE